MSEIVEWFERKGLEPGAFKYSMATEHVRLRIDFNGLTDATAFAEAFAGAVLGITLGRQ